MDGNKLRELRLKSGLKQKELGKKLGMSASTIGMYEQNRRQPDLDTLKKIAQFFEVSIDYLANNVGSSKNKEEEIKEKEILRKVLEKKGFINENEDLTDEELNRLIEFVKKNKDFIKNQSNEN